MTPPRPSRWSRSATAGTCTVEGLTPCPPLRDAERGDEVQDAVTFLSQHVVRRNLHVREKIGRASCRERVRVCVGAGESARVSELTALRRRLGGRTEPRLL